MAITYKTTVHYIILLYQIEYTAFWVCFPKTDNRLITVLFHLLIMIYTHRLSSHLDETVLITRHTDRYTAKLSGHTHEHKLLMRTIETIVLYFMLHISCIR